ncbi:ATP-binding protein [Brevibacillus porteri]|uniref:ATP-binding protein n=1 Tax=Brevibacillus porteri TaxID=2126350 RepID=UPI00370C397F
MNIDQLFRIHDDEKIGTVFKVDSYSVTVNVPNDEVLNKVSVNGFVILHTSDPNTRLVGRIDRVLRSEMDYGIVEEGTESTYKLLTHNVVHVNALGTLKGPGGGRERASFTRAVEKLPEIGANCFLLLGERLSTFTGLIAYETTEAGRPLSLGSYTMAPNAPALLDGNAFFQRHAMVVGSTGSGKSWTVARIIEQVADLPSSNMVVFDLHGEYEPLSQHANIERFRIAGPGDLGTQSEEVLYLPYWLLGYEDMLALILDRSDENAPNQSMAFSNAVLKAKQNTLLQFDMANELETFTIDSPVPYDIKEVTQELIYLNNERVTSAAGRDVNGPFNGKFNRFIPRLESKISDRRHGFLFQLGEEQLKPTYLEKLAINLMHGSYESKKGVKIIDFSEVPSDILPIIISLVARLIFQVQQWSISNKRHPIALVCDEAHLYLPARDAADASEGRALTHFERIAKEGRKYGVSLVIISQRPSELNKTIISQCNNIVALRLSNQADKSAVTSLLPENLGGIQEILPTLGVGEAVVVGDACLLPSRIKVKEPKYQPNSGSVKFWSKWQETLNEQELIKAISNLRRQTTANE